MKKRSPALTHLIAAMSLGLLAAACDSRTAPTHDPDGSATQDTWRPGQVMPKEAGPDGPIIPDTCNENRDCDNNPGGSSFCNLDQICLSAGYQGSCQAKPKLEDCPDYAECPQVCGCNGLSYCSECEAHAVGVSVVGPGGCPAPPTDCEALNNSYKQLVASAMSCCASCDYDSCTVKVFAHLNTGCPCPCEIYVSDDAQVTQALDDLAKRWVAQGCGQGFDQPMDCCAAYPACENPTSGYCDASGAGGRCVTNY